MRETDTLRVEKVAWIAGKRRALFCRNASSDVERISY
jgi:hypothetical protein